MNTERWYRMEVLFDQAMELPESARDRFLDEACAGDPELHGELKELVGAAGIPSAALHQAVIAEVDLLASDAVVSHVGRRIGPFRLSRLLGEGGMGAVYLAERHDAQFSQRVAIKILSHAIGPSEAVARFRDERQILAVFEHPNIVRLLDGGSTEDDLPYLVMEYIEGTTITRYADRHQLSVRARVELVRAVCTALQYAHQNLVVHRDIKPSNILVDASGAPKILDFGIAKLLAPVASFQREARTRTGFAMFTPEYASPEQARGDAVTTATDVYSVGAVLYELVTGQPAHRPAGSRLEILQVICEVDPPRPSAAAPAGRRRELAGDLDNIVLKALHKEPGRRYASMEQLSDDLGRWLRGLPVVARTATVGYRARKYVRRNKGVVIATALAAATLMAATVVSLRQAQRADEQATSAKVERENAELERTRAIDAAARARVETDRARAAEAQLRKRYDELQAEQGRRVRAEAAAFAQGAEADWQRRQAEAALVQARQGQLLAEKESVRARAAETLAEHAVLAEHQARKETERFHQQERERMQQERERARYSLSIILDLKPLPAQQERARARYSLSIIQDIQTPPDGVVRAAAATTR